MTCAVITGFQRSGTTVLGEWIGTSANVSYWGEIFHPDGLEHGPRAEALRLRPSANYFRFRRDVLSDEQRCAVPSILTRQEEWDSYQEVLERLRPGAVHVLNVKYSSWHHLDSAWRNPSEAPHLVTLAVERGYPVFHCLRRNILAQALSESLALATDVWHVPTDFDPPLAAATLPAVVDPALLLRRMRTCVDDAQLYRKWLRPARSYELYYEELFETEGRLSAQAIAAIRGEIADWACAGEAPLKKVGRDPRTSIANLEELGEALSESEFAGLAREYL